MKAELASLQITRNSHKSWKGNEYTLVTYYPEPGCEAIITSIQFPEKDIRRFAERMRERGIGIKYHYKQSGDGWIPIIRAPTEERADVDAKATITAHYIRSLRPSY